MTGTNILETAKGQITGKRVQDYDIPERNFELISAYWTLYKGVEFSAHDVAMMMALLKVARIQNGGGSGDSYVDLCGYASLAGEMRYERDCNDCANFADCGKTHLVDAQRAIYEPTSGQCNYKPMHWEEA